jgi:hypothetical protein
MVRILTVLHGIRSSGSTMVLIGRINAPIEQRVSGAGLEYGLLVFFSLLRKWFEKLYQVMQLMQFLSKTCSAQRNAYNPL